ncbi:MAG: type II toxin-antitoxin system PemK/MazF family toxin [Lachnospiraceae bacterium]|nr:type II toxin-antitoxin system PemK/MazF family toxin [Lachnospiraceae bacterium]
MSKAKTEQELNKHKSDAINKLNKYLDKLIKSNDDKAKGKADKLCYWLVDWCRFLGLEKNFDSKKLIKYKRGSIVKVHLGFNVGSEEGGLHYAVVLDKDNAMNSPVITVVPLTSVKSNTDLNKLKPGAIHIGNELYNSLNSKFTTKMNEVQKRLNDLKEYSDEEKASEKIPSILKELDQLRDMQSEIQNMNRGSIALVNQITTISKIRIYDPKSNHAPLKGVKLSNDKLELIDKEILKLFTKS